MCTIDDRTAKMLRHYAQKYETKEFLDGDPSWFMHQVDGKLNKEAMAFVASCISYGSRKQFMSKINNILDWCGGDIDAYIRRGLYERHFAVDDNGCFYRLYSHSKMFYFFAAYSKLLNTYGSLGEYVRQNAHRGFEAVDAICRYFGSEGVSVVVPKDVTSACKRVCMFLRWMVRDNSPVDLGLWTDFIDKRTLVMPLDTHVVTQSQRLGLIACKNTSMRVAQKLTATLTQIFPDDPLKGDFALFGYGVNNAR